MINIGAIIPVKSLAHTKSRLASILTLEERSALTVRLFQRLLRVISEVDEVGLVVVVSRDQVICDFAEASGCLALSEPQGAGLNQSIALAVKQAEQSGATHALILPSDLPFVTADDLNEIIWEVGADTAVICGDSLQIGTNAMLIPINVGICFKYGPDSFEKHAKEICRIGIAHKIMTIPNIQFDLDTEEDWNRYQLFMR